MEKGSGDEGELSKYGGFTPAQVEALFNLFKERENKERMNGKQQWVLDTGASYHNIHLFIDMFKLSSEIKIVGPNGELASVKEAGTIDFGNYMVLRHVLYIPSFAYNLIAVHRLTKDDNCIITYGAYFCTI